MPPPSLKPFLSKLPAAAAGAPAATQSWKIGRNLAPRPGQNTEKHDRIIDDLSKAFSRRNQVSAQEETDMRELQQSQIKFNPGEVYAPNDLSMEEFRARRGNRRPVKDAFDLLGVNPIKEYKNWQNYNLLSEYVSSMGRILHNKETGLRPVNQRRISKAIRRAVGIGFLPSTHKHPEILRAQEMRLQTRKW